MPPDAGRPEVSASGRSRCGDFAGAGGGSVDRNRTAEVRRLGAIDRFLAVAPIELLGALLAEVAVDDDLAGYFFCPRCQATAVKQVMLGPAAFPTSSMTWDCTNCTRRPRDRSRWEIAGAVRNRRSARDRLLDYLADEERRRG